MAEELIGTLPESKVVTTLKAADPQEADIKKNEQYSVRQYSPTAWGGFVGDAMGWLWPSQNGLVPAWGSFECDLALRVMHYTQMNALWSGAAKVWIEKFLGTPFEISGGRNKTYEWQDLFFEADFGEGYDFMMGKFLLDYLTLNRGGFIEKVSYGQPDTAILPGAKVLGLNHLDAMRIYFTGNREWPYLYQSEYYGGLHKLHYTRVIRQAAQPSANTLMFGMGKSALYDSIAVANAQTLIAKMQNELLNDMPPPGIILFNNIRPDDVEDAMEQFKADQIRDGQNVWRAPLQLSSVNPGFPATVTFIPVRTLPVDYDFEKYTLTNVNILALTTGLDPQDIWPLQTKAMGSGEQSRILSEKAETRGPGYLLKKFERVWNVTIPRELTLTYKAQNTQQDKQIAETASAWNDMANSATYLNTDEKRQLVANQVPAVADVIMDEQGVIRLYEDDPKTAMQITADDTLELSAPPSEPDMTSNSENQDLMQDIEQPTNGLALTTPKVSAIQPTSQQAITPTKQPPMNQSNKPSVTVNPAVDNKFKEIQDQLKAGLLTMAQAQTAIGIIPDPIYEGMYLVEGFPVPKEKIRELWQAHFGRGVASFDAVVSGETLPTGNGAGPVPDFSKAIRKAIDATGDAFVADVLAAIKDGMAGTVSKAGTASRIRGAIVRYGKPAFQDGLQDGGVDPNELDEDDKATIAEDNVRDSSYVTDLVNEIYSEAGLKGNPEYRASLWISTINRFYYDGIASADKNGMYIFTGENGEKPCRTCQKLYGQVHRMKDWTRHELRPGLDHDSFECGTWEPNCKHYLEKTTERASGNWA